MHNDSIICISFPVLGDWSKFVMTAMWTDDEGFRNRRAYRSQDLTEAQLHPLQKVIASLVALDAPWQATHAVASLHVPSAAAAVESPFVVEEGAAPSLPDEEAVLLTINARRADGARRLFTHGDYPDLRLNDAALIATFKHFTRHET